MKSKGIFSGAELEGVVIEFFTPDEFYCSFIEENDYIKLSETTSDEVAVAPLKNEVIKFKRFMIRLGVENVLCEVLDDLKHDEVSCQVMLCNTNVKLKVNYQSLRHLNDYISNENVVALKIHDFAPIFMKPWGSEFTGKLKDKILMKRFIIQFKSNKPDPADGKYPVNLLDFADRKCITDEFIDNKTAIRYTDFYDAWISYETKRIFDSKDRENGQYIISSPMFKEFPSRITKLSPSSPKPRFNIEAAPFTPNSYKSTESSAISPSFHFSYPHIDPVSNGNGDDPPLKPIFIPRRPSGLEVVSPLSRQVLEVVAPSKRKIIEVSLATTPVVVTPTSATPSPSTHSDDVSKQARTFSLCQPPLEFQFGSPITVVSKEQSNFLYKNQSSLLQKNFFSINNAVANRYPTPIQHQQVSPFFTPYPLQNMYMFQTAMHYPNAAPNIFQVPRPNLGQTGAGFGEVSSPEKTL